MILLGVAFWINPEFFTLAMFPNIADNDTALKAALALRKNMGAGCVFIGVTIFMCQSSPKSTAQKLLFSCAFGFFLLVAALIEVRITNGAQVPIPIITFFAVLGLISLFVASRRFQA
tara:strand:+ start:442 stop:792 length:351 start_codon:yes stop_codon:yes gene_type:complete